MTPRRRQDHFRRRRRSESPPLGFSLSPARAGGEDAGLWEEPGPARRRGAASAGRRDTRRRAEVGGRGRGRDGGPQRGSWGEEGVEGVERELRQLKRLYGV